MDQTATTPAKSGSKPQPPGFPVGAAPVQDGKPKAVRVSPSLIHHLAHGGAAPEDARPTSGISGGDEDNRRRVRAEGVRKFRDAARDLIDMLPGRQLLRKAGKGNPPPLFSEFGQPARDILTKGFQLGQSVNVIGVTPFGAMLTANGSRTEQITFGTTSATLVPMPKAQVTVSGGTLGLVQGTAAYNDRGPGFSTVLQSSFPVIPAMSRGSVFYRHPNFTLMAGAGFHAEPPLDLSMTFGGLDGDYAVGFEGGYDTKTQNVTKLHAGVGLTRDDVSVSAVYDCQEQRLLDITSSIAVNDSLSVAMQLNPQAGPHDGLKDNLVTSSGLMYKVDPKTTVKAMMTNDGIARASVQYQFRTNSTLTFTSEFAVAKKHAEQAPKFGLDLTIIQ